MSPVSGDIELDQFRIAKILTPFFTINLVASLVLFLQPFALPIFCAEFCLLAIWSAWGPGVFWKRFGTCLGIGGLLFLSQLYLWILVLAVASDFRVITVLVQWLFAAWILAQIPLWAMRYIWQWRITSNAASDLKRFSVNDNMIGITMICFAFGSCRWATDYLIDEYGPFGFEKVFSFYGWALLQFYLLIGFAGVGAWLTFRFRGLASMIFPLLLIGILYSSLTAWLWFPAVDRWLVAAILWGGTILFAWALILPLNYVKSLGYRLFRGTKAA